MTAAPFPAEGPTLRSYWVVPDRLLAGGYPSTWRPQGANVHEAVASGVRTFVNLTEDTDPDSADGHLETYDASLPDAGPEISVLRFPIKDLSVPTVELMVGILDAIDAAIETRPGVFVHCWGGIGRTGTAVGCWLIRHGRATSQTVLDVLADLRRQDLLASGCRSPETAQQRRFVIEWEPGR
jgi:protein tyrosine phosphatase